MAVASVGVRRSSKNEIPKLPPLPNFAGSNRSPKVEVREDEEQEVKLQEIVELLLAAGYFRARIKGLSPFDKVVGGMTWCIEICNVDIDVDLLFQENLTIGQKISLTEKIVAVLPQMKCPHSIEPHQIQGLDFIHIFPVIQWLVKRAIETREETGDYIRAFSISQFHKNYSMPQDELEHSMQEKMKISYKDLKETYRPQRLFRHHAPDKIKEEEIRVQTTLLEYGKKFGTAQTPSEKQQDGQSVESATEQKVAEEEKQIQNLMKGMSVMEEHEGKLTVSSVGSIVGLQSDEIQQIASEFAEKQLELASEGRGERGIGGAEYHKRMMASLSHQHVENEKMLTNFSSLNSEFKQNYEESHSKLKELQDQYSQMMKEMKVLEEAETGNNKSVLEKLRSLVAMNESLKTQEQQFRAHCKEEKARLAASIEELKEPSADRSPEDDERRQHIEKQYITATEKLKKIRVLLARKNREIAALQRKIDEVPSRAELSQYQKRFVELYNQVAAKHKETKQFYTLYNTLEDTRMFLMKEDIINTLKIVLSYQPHDYISSLGVKQTCKTSVDLLNSIQDNFTEAMSSSSSKEEFLAQMEQIVERIQQNKLKLEKKKQGEKMQRDIFNDQLLDLIEKQRLYFKTVKEFKEECRKNEILVAKLKEKTK